MLMHVADSMGFTLNTFTHILEGYKVADKMAEHGAGGSSFSDWWAYKFEVKDAIPHNGAILHEQGVVTAFAGKVFMLPLLRVADYPRMAGPAGIVAAVNERSVPFLDRRVASAATMDFESPGTCLGTGRPLADLGQSMDRPVSITADLLVFEAIYHP